MKIALCFFGITRNLKQNALSSIERFLLAPIARVDPAYKRFGHFNQVHCILNPRTGERNVPVDPEEYRLLNCDFISNTDQSWLDEQLDPEFLHLREYGDSWHDNFASLRNLVRQLYSLNQVAELLVRSGQSFDLVIYSRADIRFEKPVEVAEVRPRTVYTPWFDKFRGLNDRFAMGDFGTMVEYGRRASFTREYCLKTDLPLHAERFLLWYTRKRQLANVDLTSIDFRLARAHGRIEPLDTGARAKLRYRVKRLLRH